MSEARTGWQAWKASEEADFGAKSKAPRSMGAAMGPLL